MKIGDGAEITEGVEVTEADEPTEGEELTDGDEPTEGDELPPNTTVEPPDAGASTRYAKTTACERTVPPSRGPYDVGGLVGA